ncbi:hypothetical protein [uncultured Reyranella sp.]|uniref:hypothetical protein n=1 Tax=uncultured Reyranella sp. TaxID=735512 RepID=UPI0025FDB1F0|nr:hypothetical protein [uncultured Reyranella sp.]
MGMSNHFGVRKRRLRRRSAFTLAPLLHLPTKVTAQVPSTLPRVGVIAWERPETVIRMDEVCQAMKTGGHRDGVNVSFEWRWVSGSRARAAAPLLTCGPYLQEAYRRLALYIVRILDGTKPENLATADGIIE